MDLSKVSNELISAAEYALILAIVGIGIVVAAQGLRTQISGAMDRAASKINSAS